MSSGTVCDMLNQNMFIRNKEVRGSRMMKYLSQAFKGSGKIFTAALVLVFIIAASVLTGSGQLALAQEEPELYEVGDYQSIDGGNWDNPENWQVYDGTEWVDATDYPGHQPGDYTVTIQSGHEMNDNNVGILYFGDLIVYGRLSLSHYLTLDSTDHLLVDGYYFDENDTLTGGAIYWYASVRLNLPADATLEVSNIKDEYDQVIEGLGLYAPHAANNNMRIRIGAVDYASATGEGNVVCTFDMINESGGALAAVATADPDELEYNGSVLTTELTGNATGFGSDPAEATLSFYWTGTGPGSFTFSSSEQNPGVVDLNAGGVTYAGDYTFTFTVTSTYIDTGSTYSTSDDAVVTVNPASLNITGITGVNKMYDGTTAAEVDSSGAALVVVIPGDDVDIDTSGATATFADKNVGSGKTVTVMGLSLTGADMGNYTLIQPTITADITPRELTFTDITGVNKIYDGTTSAEVDSSGAVLVGVIPPDDVSVDASDATATFGDENVGSGRTVTLVGLSITGADAGNYTLIQPTTTADITPRELTVTGITGVNKIYDGTTVAEVDSSGAALVVVIPGNDVNIDASVVTATFGDKNVGSGKTVTVMGLSLTGADMGNYTLILPTTTADITPRELTIMANSFSKTHGDTVTFAGTEFAATGLLNGDTISSVTLTSDGAADTAAAGTYDIVPSEAVGTGIENYDITYIDGELTVEAGGGGLSWWIILLIVLAAIIVLYLIIWYIRKRRQSQVYFG